MARFEYQVETINPWKTDITDLLVSLGSLGWELVAVTAHPSNGIIPASERLYFKRRID